MTMIDPGSSVVAARRALARMFAAAGLETPELDARVLVGHALGLDHAALAGAADRPLDNEARRGIGGLASRRLAREPVARIVGCKEFWGLPIRVTPDVLVPRPETETLVETALAALSAQGPRAHPWRVADLGTGREQHRLGGVEVVSAQIVDTGQHFEPIDATLPSFAGLHADAGPMPADTDGSGDG